MCEQREQMGYAGGALVVFLLWLAIFHFFVPFWWIVIMIVIGAIGHYGGAFLRHYFPRVHEFISEIRE